MFVHPTDVKQGPYCDMSVHVPLAADPGDAIQDHGMKHILQDYENNFRPTFASCCRNSTTGFVSGLRL